jgi:dienelactone hydrolase
MQIFRFLLFTALLSGCCALAAEERKASLGYDDSGRIWFASAGSIAKGADGGRYLVEDQPATISGELQFPPGAGPFPAIILAHGCAGNGYAEGTWTPLLHQWGYATFVVDSFGGRGITSVCNDMWRLIPLQRVPDVYGALRILATHPRIASDRIALMGFSHGGIVAGSAATIWARDIYARPGLPRFRGFFAFYPACSSRYPERENIYAPLRIHSGELDDWTPAKPCQEWIERLRAKGYDATITLYQRAHYAFDAPFGFEMRLPGVQNAAACHSVYESILGPYEVEKNYSGCLTQGATAGRNVQAIEEAQRVLRNQIADLLNN